MRHWSWSFRFTHFDDNKIFLELSIKITKILQFQLLNANKSQGLWIISKDKKLDNFVLLLVHQ
jgi:hypothetical protein